MTSTTSSDTPSGQSSKPDKTKGSASTASSEASESRFQDCQYCGGAHVESECPNNPDSINNCPLCGMKDYDPRWHDCHEGSYHD